MEGEVGGARADISQGGGVGEPEKKGWIGEGGVTKLLADLGLTSL